MSRFPLLSVVFASILGGLPLSASADSFDGTLTGYTFMGGASAYANRDYFLVGSLNYDYSGANYWGCAWLKFDNLGASPVPSARLDLNLLGVGSMSFVPATPENPAVVNVYSAGDIDVAGLAGSRDLRDELRDALDASAPLATVTMTADGAHSLDITSLYNSWVSGTAANHGIVLAAPDNGLGSKFAGVGAVGAPSIHTVPEPGTVVLVGVCLVAIGAARMMRGRL